MGTPLTGSSVASTYSSLLKTTDSTTFTTTLKTICDGAGNNSSFQLASTSAAFLATLDIAGNFTVATNKFIVAAATGNTTVAGTLAVAAATTLSTTLAVTGAAVFSSTVSASGNISTSGGNLSVYGNINQSNAGASSTFAGGLTVGNAAVFNSGVTFNSTTSFTSAISVAGITNSGTFLSTGAATIGTVGGAALGSTTLTSATVSGFLTVAGPSSLNGNTTLGDAAGDTVTVGAATVTFSNLATKTTPVSADTLLLRDSADSNKLKLVAFSSVGAAKFIYSETISRAPGSEQSNTLASPPSFPGYYAALQQSGSTSDWSYTWTPRAVGNKALLKVSIPVTTSSDVAIYAGIVRDSSSLGVGEVIAVAGCYAPDSRAVVLVAECTFTSTASTHTFKVWFGTAGASTLTIAQNGTATWFNNDASSRNAKVQFELIEF
jgi:hypothetical protein